MIPSLNFLDRLSVLVVGDVMLDRYLWGEVRRISPEAPVPIVWVQRETHTAGGAANVALNLASLGVRCELFGTIGSDANGAELRALLAQRGVAFDERLVRSCPTITKTRVMAQRQQVCRIDWESEAEAYTLEETGLLALLAEKAARHKAVIISDYAKGLITQPVVDTLRKVRATHGIFLAIDPKPRRPLEIAGLDLLTPNRSEALELAGLPDAAGRDIASLEDVAQSIAVRYQPEYLVMTLSELGMLLRRPDGFTQHFATIAREVADVSGAGDTVISTLTAALAGGLAPAEAVHVANVAAGIVVGKLGTATVTRSELTEAMQAEADATVRAGSPAADFSTS